jgi:DNA-binding beta-propeller fold protein YncE
VIDRLQLRENLTGRSVLNSSRDVLYSVSASGVTVFPVGQLAKAPRIRAEQRDVLFRGSTCSRQQQTQEVAIVDASGGHVAFALTPSDPGITVSPDSGVTPAVVRITVDPGAFLNSKGTTAGYIDIKSPGVVNIPDRIRVLVNNREPDQRGMVQNVPGKLVDVLADAVRNRFMIVRQDTNEVLVFDRNLKQVAALRTGNTPTQMAISPDLRYLLVGNDNSQVASVFDLDTLRPSAPIRFPFGHYPRSIAVSGNAILASVRSAGGPHTIDRIDMVTRTAFTPPSLGAYSNDVTLDTSLAASSDGSKILIALSDGRVLLYDANFDAFVAARKDFDKLSGAVAASSYDFFVVDNNVLNASLVPLGTLDKNSGSSSGFIFVDLVGFRSNSLGTAQAGMLERVNLSQLQSILPTRVTESPLTTAAGTGFTRTLAVLGNREGLIGLYGTAVELRCLLCATAD